MVAKGFMQKYGLDYQETFAPVAKMNTVRLLLALAAHRGWTLQQYDVKNAFLHGDLTEEIYMALPPGYSSLVSSTPASVVCRLRKSIYSLKQSPRAWFARFTTAMRTRGYRQCNGDHTLFFRHSTSGGVVILLVYVDDIIITGDDTSTIGDLVLYLGSEFAIKHLGLLRYFLGIEVAYSSDGLFICQRKYTIDLLQELGKEDSRPLPTPIEANHKLGADENEALVDPGSYQRLVGKLIYLTHTRPDIAYTVGVLSQFMHTPRVSHLHAAHRVLRFLKGTVGRGLLFRRHSGLDLEVYTDADYAGSIVDRRSTSGYCTFLGGNLITWCSKKQKVVSRSSAEAEFRALAQGLCEALWITRILRELRCPVSSPVRLFCDNKSAISIAHDPVQHDRTKHIEIDRHFIKEKLESGRFCTPYVPSADQQADIFTKGLHALRFEELCDKLGVENIHAPA